MPIHRALALPGGRAVPSRHHAALLLAVALAATSCSRAGAAAPPPEKAIGHGRFRVAIDQPASLDPVLASQPAERLIATQLFDGLVSYDATTAAVVPAVATSWDVSPDFTMYTFHLRSDARFSDGEHVSAESFVRGMTRALSPALRSAPGSLSSELDDVVGAPAVIAGTAPSLAGAVALNATTLQIQLSGPDAEFLIRCGDGPFDPVPSVAMGSGWAVSPVGNGAFALAAAPAGGWLHSGSITLVPNRYHTPALPHVAEVVLKVIPAVADAYRAFLAGQVDWAPIPPTATAQVKALGKQSYIEGPLVATGYLTVVAPSGTPDATAAAVREAVSLGIDRSQVVAQVFGQAAAPATGFVPPLVPGSASPGTACAFCTFDPARARATLAGSGATLGGSLPLYFAAGVGEDAWVQGVAHDLQAALGVATEAIPVADSPSTGLPQVPPTPGWSLEAQTKVMDYPAPDDFVSLLASGTATTVAETLTQAITSARAEGDAGARAARYQSIERLAMASLPVIPVLWPRGVVLARLSTWSGLGMDPFGDPTLRTVTRKG
jgi:oligopeptide transport system substrate-binding protein